MVDIFLAASLMRALDKGTRLIMWATTTSCLLLAPGLSYGTS